MTFNEYLMVKCINETHALDDDLPDVFESWISEQDVAQVVEWAEKWGEEIEQRNWQICIECSEPVDPETNSALNCHSSCRMEL